MMPKGIHPSQTQNHRSMGRLLNSSHLQLHRFLFHSHTHYPLSSLIVHRRQFQTHLSFYRHYHMNPIVSKVAVVGSGISGAVCASTLAKNGVSVTIFDSGRGPAGRMSRRREIMEDGKELFFDHGAPLFTINDNDAMTLVSEWESRGLVAEWKENFGTFDFVARKFVDFEKEGSMKKYVGTPGMNSICRALCSEPGVETKFGTTVGKIKWLEDKNMWMLIDLDGTILGHFDAVVASDKNVFSPRFTSVTGRPPPLDMTLVSELAPKLQEVPVVPCFTVMLAFLEPLSSVYVSELGISNLLVGRLYFPLAPTELGVSCMYRYCADRPTISCALNGISKIPVRGFSFTNSDVLRWAFCDSSKPGRLATSECWVLHSTAKYAECVIAESGLQKPSSSLLSKVAEELFQEFEKTGYAIPRPFFMKAHRWGAAFPGIAVAGEEKCLYNSGKRLTICGDFCVSPNVEGAVLSGMSAATKLLDLCRFSS